MNEKVLVTGCAGFIGSNLVDRLVEEGFIVDGVDDLSNGFTQFINDKINVFVKEDFASEQVKYMVDKNDYLAVFHLAAVPRVGYSVAHPAETNDTNVTKTLKLMEACRDKIGRFVFASSSSVYGGSDILPTTEDMPTHPRSPYALQKKVIEDYLKMYKDLHDFESVSLRFFNVFGPRAMGSSPYATALASWLTAIKQDRPMRSDGDGTQSRDLCYVDNVVDACFRAAFWFDDFNGDHFNVSCGTRTTNNEILEYLCDRYPNASIIPAPERLGDVKHTHASYEKANASFGYVPLVDVWEGVRRTCDWYDRNVHLVNDCALRV